MSETVAPASAMGARLTRRTTFELAVPAGLDATTGVTYWEGSQIVRATRAGAPLGGEAYVELTGYAPSGLASP